MSKEKQPPDGTETRPWEWPWPQSETGEFVKTSWGTSKVIAVTPPTFTVQLFPKPRSGFEYQSLPIKEAFDE